jgi:hypothetical protein
MSIHFTRDNLPPPAAQPEFLFDLPELKFPERMNCATELLDRHVAEGRGRACLHPGTQPALDLCRPAGEGQPHRQRAGEGPRRGSWQSRTAARAEQPDDGCLLVRGDESRRCRHGDHAAVARQGTQARDRQGESEPRAVRPAPGGRTQTRRRRIARAETYPLVQRRLGRRPRSGDGEAVGRIQERRHRARRHLHPRLHLGHHRPAQGDHALPPRRHGAPASAGRPMCCGRRPTTFSWAHRRWPSPSA